MANTTNTTYTFTGLNPETEYKVTVKAKDAAGNTSAGVSVNGSTGVAPVETAEHYLYMDGIDDYLQVKFIPQTTEYVIEMELPNRTVITPTSTIFFNNYHWVKRDSIADTWSDTATTSVYVDDVLVTSGTDAFPGERKFTLRIVKSTPIAANNLCFFGSSWDKKSNAEMKIHDVKIYNGATLVAHYDMSTQTLTDQSGNGMIAEVNATNPPVFMLPEPPDTTAPGEVSNIQYTSEIDSVTLTWNNPVDADFSHVRILRDGVQIIDDITSGIYLDDEGLTSSTSYTYTLITTDIHGNESVGVTHTVTTAEDLSIVPEVTNVTETHTHEYVKLSWKKPTEAHQHIKILRDGVEIANNLTTETYTDYGLTMGATYAYKIVVIGTTGKASTGTDISVTTDATIRPMQLYMIGQGYYNEIISPTGVSYDRIVMDFMPDEQYVTNKGYTLLKIKDDFGPGITYSPTGADSTHASFISRKVNGVDETANTNYLPAPGNRITLELGLDRVYTDKIFFCGRHSDNVNFQGYFHNIKLYNGATLTAHYDMGKGTINDQTGNGYHATVTGGIWVKEGDPIIDTVAPLDVSNLTVSNVTETSLTLTWVERFKVKDFARYDIYQDGVLIGNTTGLNYAVTGLTANTQYTFKVIAVDTLGNQSVGESFKVATDITLSVSQMPPVADAAIFDLSLIDNEGSSVRTFYDGIKNVKVDLKNDGINVSDRRTQTYNNINYGFLSHRGYKLQENSHRVTINTGVSTLPTSVNMANGFTFEFIAAGNPTRIQLLNSTQLKWFIDQNSLTVNYTYLDGTGAQKTTSATNITSTGLMTHLKGGSSARIGDALRPAGEPNVFALTLNLDGSIDLFLNDYTYHVAAPADFSSYVNWFSQTSLTSGGISSYDPGDYDVTLSKMVMHNRPLTSAEYLNNYEFYNKLFPLEDVIVSPSVIEMSIGNTRTIAVSIVPEYYQNLVTVAYESGNDGFASVNQSGLVTGVANGQTNISITTTYEAQEIIKYVDVTVQDGSGSETVGISSREVTGVSINKKIDTLEVGDYYTVMATTMPYDIFFDSVVTWESLNPTICSVKYGVLNAKAAGTATIVAWDETRTYSDRFTVTVTVPVEETITEAQIYNVVPVDYALQLDNTDSLNTTNGIQAAMDYASTNGYRKIVFPYGTYLVNPTVREFYLPNELIVDFSDSIINIEPSTLTATGYSMFNIIEVSNTKLTRAHIYGEKDFTTLQESHEGCVSVIIEGGYKSGIESCTVSKSPGFNLVTSNRLVTAGTGTGKLPKDIFVPGTINDNGIDDDSITNWHFRTIGHVDISTLGENFMIGYNQGYFGYPYMRSRLYSIFFYDVNKNFISAQKYNLQFYDYKVPEGAYYCRVVIYQENAPTVQSGDFSSIALIRTIVTPRRCFIKNCVIEDNNSTGAALCGGYDNQIIGNTFSRNKGRMPGCDIDYEDGWENACGDIVTNNTFNSPLGLTFAAGSSPAVFNNTFNNSQLVTWSRTQNFRIFSNTFNGYPPGGGNITLGTQGDSYFAENTLHGIRFSTSTNHENVNYKVHTPNNVLL